MPRPYRPPVGPLALLLAGVLGPLLAPAPAARAQAVPLFLADEDTKVRAVAFKFTETQTFSEGELRAVLATRGPSTVDKFKSVVSKVLPFVQPKKYPLEPIEVQKDVVRLRQFYRLNGFFLADIDYPASQLDTSNNTIRIIFSVDEGPPLLVDSVQIRARDSTGAPVTFPGDLAREWERFPRQTTLQPGRRFTSVDYAVLKGQVLDWARNRGYAFAGVTADSTVNLDSLRIRLRLTLTPGPSTVVDRVLVQGNTSVADRVVRREIPVRVGRPFRQRELVQGQRELFGLNLFRASTADVPVQPVDSTVTVRYSVREARPRLLTAESGYSFEEGVQLQGAWTHRNFFGGARTLTVSADWQSGLGARSSDLGITSLELAVTLRQPYLFNRKTSGTIGPYLRESHYAALGIDYREAGNRTGVVHELLPFRTLSLQHDFGRVLSKDSIGNFSRSVLTASARLGKVNDFFNPRRGFLIRPTAEFAGGFFASDVQYGKVGGDVLGFTTLSRRVDGFARVFAGRLFPFGRSEDQAASRTRQRFATIRYLAGGSSDVRGWNLGQLGPQRVDFNDQRTAPPTVGVRLEDARYVPEGGLTKVAVNLEGRFPFPGLSDNWRTAAFVDAGAVGRPGALNDPALGALRVGAGGGLRYLTPVGYLRFDLAYKLNPADSDRYTAAEYFRRFVAGEDVRVSTWQQFVRRLGIHLSIGQTF